MWRKAESLTHRERVTRYSFSRLWRTIAHWEPGSPRHQSHGCHPSQTERRLLYRRRSQRTQLRGDVLLSREIL